MARRGKKMYSQGRKGLVLRKLKAVYLFLLTFVSEGGSLSKVNSLFCLASGEQIILTCLQGVQ